jgi:hypothetical protein
MSIRSMTYYCKSELFKTAPMQPTLRHNYMALPPIYRLSNSNTLDQLVRSSCTYLPQQSDRSSCAPLNPMGLKSTRLSLCLRAVSKFQLSQQNSTCDINSSSANFRFIDQCIGQARFYGGAGGLRPPPVSFNALSRWTSGRNRLGIRPPRTFGLETRLV